MCGCELVVYVFFPFMSHGRKAIIWEGLTRVLSSGVMIWGIWEAGLGNHGGIFLMRTRSLVLALGILFAGLDPRPFRAGVIFLDHEVVKYL